MDSALKPLFANLKRLKIGRYLSTDDFNHFSLEKDFDEEWEECLKIVKVKRRSFSTITFLQDNENDCETAFGILMNKWYAVEKSSFNSWILEVLLNFANWNKYKLNFSNVISNLRELNVSKNNLINFATDFRKIQLTKNKVTMKIFESSEIKEQVLTNKVFIVHGHDEKSRLELCNILKDELSLEPVVLLEKPNSSIETIISKFERLANDCTYAIVLLTPDDIIGENKRARQNVVFELGYFLGKFQRTHDRKIIIIKKAGVEIPSDISGVLYLEYIKDVKEVFLD